MSVHDPLCPVSDDPSRREHCGVCDLIAKVRADERERNKAKVEAAGRWCREDERATLRAQVEALRAAPSSGPYAYGSGYRNACVDMLVLLDGGGP